MDIKLSQLKKHAKICNILQSEDLKDNSYYRAVLDLAQLHRDLGVEDRANLSTSVIMATIRCISSEFSTEADESKITEHITRVLEIIPEAYISDVMNAIKAAKDANDAKKYR